MDEYASDEEPTYLVGKCNEMCPKSEMLLREEENLLHRFEMRADAGMGNGPKADASKAVKSYRRSGAGRKMSESDLRPFPVLMKTIKYLYENIFPLHKNDPLTVYDFMFDRFRAIRQDMVVQNLTPLEYIKILEPIARFHIYFRYILCEESDMNFDAFINYMHLQECLTSLLVNYEECERCDLIEDLSPSGNYFKNRSDMECAYLLLNMSNCETLTRAAKLDDSYIKKDLLELCFAWYLKNYAKVFKMMKNLPPLLACIISGHVPEMRKYALQTMSKSYSCSNSSYPISKLKDLLLYDDTVQVTDDCSYFSMRVTGKNVNFMKKFFKTSAKTQKPRRLPWVDEILAKSNMVELLCSGGHDKIQ